MEETKLIKHPLPQRIVHWFNASCFLFLWLTGIAVITSTGYRIAPQFYIDLMLGLFGSAHNLLHAHAWVGLVWFTVMGVSFLLDPHGLSLRFLKDLVPTRNDIRWIKLRPKAELSDEIELPKQGAYNAGQKAFGVAVLVGSITIGITGVLMWFGTNGGGIARWMVLLHLLAVGGVIAFFFVHFSMAALLKEERPALKSMVAGEVDPHYAEHHHAEWFEAHQAEGGEAIHADERFALPRAVGRQLARGWRWIVDRPEKGEWSPYAAGVGLGLTVLVAFVLLGHGPGASGLFSRLGAFGLAEIAPDHVASNAYWGPVLDKGLADYWLLWTVLGMAAGGFVSAALGGRIESGIDRGALVSPRTRLLLAVFGGMVVGFATRFTRGCTSHQALSNGALLSVGAWVFMLSVFGGGFAAAFFLRRIWR